MDNINYDQEILAWYDKDNSDGDIDDAVYPEDN